jgi:4-amino-4-deoxy-L-arabinose transferase-like glycosyltransferase
MPPRERVQPNKLLLALATFGVLLRVVTTIWAGNGIETPWPAGGDALFYVRLASNIASGRGFAYYGGPTAFRPPLYPLFLAGMMRLFGDSALFATRIVQLSAGLVTAWLCKRTASRIFSEEAGGIALVIALFLPTLVALSPELMTECFATLLAALFFDFILLNRALLKWRTTVFLGLIVGLATLLRFNMAILGLAALAGLATGLDWPQAWRRMCLLAVVAGLVTAPWIVRNLIVFHGRIILSTQGGMNAVQGVLTPQGRRQGNDLYVLRSAVGWVARDVESNDPPPYTYKLAPEPELDRRAWAQTFELWRKENWRLIPLSLRKLGYFWLSTDQIFWTNSFSWKQRIVRLGGALAQWLVLGVAVVGWFRLSRNHARISGFLLGYTVLVSLAHLPFIMASRYRVPFLETVLAVLAAGGFPLWARIASYRPASKTMG